MRSSTCEFAIVLLMAHPDLAVAEWQSLGSGMDNAVVSLAVREGRAVPAGINTVRITNGSVAAVEKVDCLSSPRVRRGREASSPAAIPVAGSGEAV